VAFQAPAYIAFTGVDRMEIREALQALSSRYPIEWGILIDDSRSGSALFPDGPVRERLLSGSALRWAAHVCGEQAKLIAHSPHRARITLAGYQRVQINHSCHGSADFNIANSCLFGRHAGVRTVLQCSGPFPRDMRVDWLFDTSFGRGSMPRVWPSLPSNGPFCGYSGGLGPENVREALEKIAAPADALYWIDMESGVRTDGWLDVGKCEAVCRAVYG
jgi:hypothetical protein